MSVTSLWILLSVEGYRWRDAAGNRATSYRERKHGGERKRERKNVMSSAAWWNMPLTVIVIMLFRRAAVCAMWTHKKVKIGYIMNEREIAFSLSYIRRT